MVEFVTINETTVKFGDNNFFDIAHKKVIVDDECDKHFVSITRGYYKDGVDKKYTKALSIPTEDKKVLKDVICAFINILTEL